MVSATLHLWRTGSHRTCVAERESNAGALATHGATCRSERHLRQVPGALSVTPSCRFRHVTYFV